MNPPAAATYFDHIDRERAVREHQGAARRFALHFKALGVAVLVCVLLYGAYTYAGLRSIAQTTGTVPAKGLLAPAQIVRDARGIPHVLAASQHDLFFAEGYAQASDRLVQMDLLRRYVLGRISEIVGPIQLSSDIEMRYLDAHDIVDRQWRHLSAGDRAVLQAFSDGVNAAMRGQPAPFEFRFFLYSPQPWTPQDSLAVTLGICASLDDPASNVIGRDALWKKLAPGEFDRILPLSDGRYDVTADARFVRERSLQPPAIVASAVRLQRSLRGSNAWAAGASRTATHRALLANDPHLELTIPGIWYLIEMQAPGFHVAGATIPGIPGVILGHNERVAWGSTNAVAASVSVFRTQKLSPRNWHREIFHVRGSRDVVKMYYRTPREIGIPADNDGTIVLARWAPYAASRSPLSTILGLDRAVSVRDAISVLSRYAGPVQNFVAGDTAGEVAYHLAGPITNDPAWGRYIHPAKAIAQAFRRIPFERLPALAPSRSGVVVSANNKMYAPGYPYRLSAEFAPPYRAYRIAQLLAARKRYDVAYFERMQLDAVSPADAEIAHEAASYAAAHPGTLDRAVIRALRSWNGSYDASSRIATLEYALRANLQSNAISPYAPFLMMRAHGNADLQYALRAVNGVKRRWGQAGAVPVLHPMGSSVLSFLNGAVLPGNGNEYTVRMQTPALTQSFRAVWDVGNWEAGGIAIPSGESGERGSPHYADQSGDWISGKLLPLPFSRDAVLRNARDVLTLTPP